MAKLKLKKSYIGLFLLFVIFIFSIYLFKFAGLRTFIGFYIILILPTYLFLKVIDIEEDERIFFAIFLGLIIAPLLIWYVDRIFSALRLSTIVTAVILYMVAFILIYIKRNKAKM